MKKVISFSLYGSKATYIIGMKENIKLAKQHFSDWEVIIYHNNTVPENYINEYKELDAICILCKNIGENKLNWEGMFWRWLPLDDPEVDIWISRDADSRLSEREAKIVDEWINSGKTLHSIRDHRCHFNYIMGGMFGINNKLFHEKYKFKTVSQIIKELSVYYKERSYNVDQIFLNDKLWNLLKNDMMAHISKDGRRVYSSDILIPSVPDFIGKQYRLNDFPENIIKYLDKNKGCYWKESTSQSVYWSISSIDIKPDVKFNNQGEYFMHRVEHGFPQNWSQIQILDGINIDEKPNFIEKLKNKEKDRYAILKKPPLVSIAISTFESGGKGHELLKHNFEQIFKQDYENIEIVISDHSSDNKIKELCKEYDGKKYPIKYIHNPEYKGNSSQNTNNAIKYCNGEYIKILFMDDYLYNESAITIIVENFEKNIDKKWLVHSYKHTKDYKEFYNLHHPKFSHDIVFCNRIGTPSCLTIHNSVKERFDENLKWFMDSELYKRILDKYGQPIFLHTKEDIKPLMINLHHDGQVTNTSIDKDLIVKEKEYITNKTNDKTLMELVDNSRTDKNTIHAYLELYQKLFKSKKSSANNILEVGLGQRGNCHCGSAKLWFDYFLNADIYAIDIYDESYLWEGIKNKERIKLFTSTNAYNEIEFNEKLLKKNIKFDILLDDGSHMLDDMKQFIKLYTQILKDDGILIIEDIPKIEWLDILKNEVPEHLKSYIKTYDLRDKKNRFDDIVFTINLS